MPSKPLIRLVVLNVLLAVLATGSAEAATKTYTLMWNPNAETDVTGYVVSWGTQSGGPYTTGSQAIAGKATTTASVILDASVTYYLVLQAKNAAGALSGFSAQVSTALPPAITTQPASLSIGIGATATMSVTATGTAPLTYQWYVGASGSTVSPIAGATSSSYTTPPLTAPTNNYWVRVSNAGGPTDSLTATITVSGIVITSQPVNQLIRFGQTAMFSVVTSGAAPSLQWQISPNGGASWFNLANNAQYSGVTTATLAVSGATPALNDTRYRCVATNFTGSATSNAATLSLLLGVAHSDFDGDNKADLTVYRPSTGMWYVNKSSTGFGSYLAQSWGMSTDIPMPGDYDGDGKPDIAVYRPSTGTWWILESSTNYTTFLSQPWGMIGDIPVAGDFDGDGTTDIAIYRPSTGTWWILKSSTNFTTAFSQTWGTSSDIPVTGDFDGDGKTDIAVYRPSTGIWYVLKSSTNYTNYLALAWGLSTDIPVVGDFDGDGKTDIAVYRPSTGIWYILKSSTAFSNYLALAWGLSTDIPVPGDFDGDGKTDIAVYRPSTGMWYILRSGTAFSSYLAQPWGLSTDVP